MRLMSRIAVLASTTALILTSAPLQAAGDWQPFKQQAFDAAVQSGKGVVLHFHADWCPVCRAQATILMDIVRSDKLVMSGTTAFKASYDTESALRAKLGVGRQSTIIVFKGRKEVGRSTSVTDRRALEMLIAKAY